MFSPDNYDLQGLIGVKDQRINQSINQSITTTGLIQTKFSGLTSCENIAFRLLDSKAAKPRRQKQRKKKEEEEEEKEEEEKEEEEKEEEEKEEEEEGDTQTPSTGLRHPSFNHCRI